MRKKWMALLAIAVFGSDGCAESAPPEWPTECAGRLQFALPGEADQAAYLFKEIIRDPAQYSGPWMRFPDGERHGGETEFSDSTITHPLTGDEKPEAFKEFRAILDRIEKYSKTKAEELPTGKHIGQAWMVPNRHVGLDVIISDSVFLWGQEAESEAEFAQVKEKFNRLIDGLRPRPLFDVPAESGLCLPYVFVPDSGQEKHSVAMAYRLKAHPDITVSLRGRSAATTPTEETMRDWRDRRRPGTESNEFQAFLFWGSKLTNTQSDRSVFRFPAKRPMTLGGRSGLETFLAVVREKETEEDYIYHAVARGDPDTPEAAPDIQLVVEQKRRNAVKRGLAPLTQEEVLTLARRIAASVSVRPAR